MKYINAIAVIGAGILAVGILLWIVWILTVVCGRDCDLLSVIGAGCMAVGGFILVPASFALAIRGE